MKRTVFSLAWLALAGSLSATAYAESLEDAWQAALSASRPLRADHYRIEAAREDVRAAEAAGRPKLDLQGSWTALDHEPRARVDLSPFRRGPLAAVVPGSLEVPLADNSLALAQAKVSLPVYTSGRLDALRDAARLAEAATAHGTDRTRLDVKLQVAETYFAVLRAQEARQVAAQYLDSLTAYRRDVGNFHSQGLVPRGDVLGADVALADARQKVIAADEAFRVASAAYNRLLGRPFDQPVRLDDRSLPRETRRYEDLVQLAGERRPELAALSARSQALQARSRSVRAEGGPQVGVFASYQYLDHPALVKKGIAAAGIGVEWAVFDSGLTRARAASVAREAEAAQEERDDAESLIRLDVRQALSQENDAAERLKVAEAALASADEYLLIQRDRYANGLASQTEVLTAEARRAESRRNLFNARYDHALAVYRIRRATGEL